MGKPIVFMFPGQGSQYYHMGEELYHRHPDFRKWMEQLDHIIVDMTGESILHQLYDDKRKTSDIFDCIRYTHPAIFMVEYALSRALTGSGPEPGIVMGSSLGEFAAAALSGVMTIEEAVEMVVKQAEIIETHCQQGEGGMMTILHDPTIYHESPLLHQHTELAAINYNSHFVVSGKKEALIEIQHFLKERDIVFQLLPVSFAFHSRLMEPAGSAYCSYLKEKQFQRPNCTFVSCMTGGVIDEIPPDYFWEIVRQPMVFREALHNLEKIQSHIYIDLGPSGTLQNFVKNNLTEPAASMHFAIMTPFGSDLKRLEQFNEFFLSNRPFAVRKEEKKMKAYLFPGQGSQQQGMGEDLFDEFKDLTRKADDILGYSIKTLCLENPDEQLLQTQFTQPAVYVVNALSYLKKSRAEPKPDYVLGHSVGEYDALLASGVVDFETGLKLVKKRGELMGQARGGGMAAVMGLTADQVEKILKENNFTNLYIANYNSSYQVVISGLNEEIARAESVFLDRGATHYRILNVSGAFHTPYMAEAKKKFNKFVKKFKFAEITIPIIANVTARPYQQEEIKDNIIEQITTPVKWMDSIRYLLAKGVDIDGFHEVSGIELSVVKALAIRINNEAGPLDLPKEEAQKKPKEQLKKKKEKTGKPIKIEKKKIAAPMPTDKKIEPVLQGDTGNGKITGESLGSAEFKQDYGLTYAYLTGGMYKGIASKEMVVKMGRAGMMGFFGTGGLELADIETAIGYIKNELDNGEAYGMNLVSNPLDPGVEEEVVDLFLKYGIRTIEAAAFLTITPALVKYRAKEFNRIIAKVSRPEVAEQFLSPVPERIAKKLVEANKITREEAGLLKQVPMADDICVEADSGGHTDQGMPYALMPAMLKLRDEMMEKYKYPKPIRVGAAGGIGTPQAAAAAFILGADFILTGSINQCSVEAATSDAVKDLLQQINVQDTDYAPAGDMFELGAKVQVLKRGVFFPARANKLYELYRQYNSIDNIDEKTKKQLQERYFKRTFDEIYREVKSFYPAQEIEKADKNPKHKMALIFRWYFGYGSRLALSGDESDKVNYQVQCGPALGAFNQWVKGTPLEDWRNRHVDEMGKKMMQETAELLNQRFQHFIK
ncbi:MAG: ACP S-malonyltransferase [Candidatus Aminicenantes bacterium]|nr:MAG: ACP S-malonyltransferase [Candidatus Aminicenantes bacterium]